MSYGLTESVYDVTTLVKNASATNSFYVAVENTNYADIGVEQIYLDVTAQ